MRMTSHSSKFPFASLLPVSFISALLLQFMAYLTACHHSPSTEMSRQQHQEKSSEFIYSVGMFSTEILEKIC